MAEVNREGQAFMPGQEPAKNKKIHPKAVAFWNAERDYKTAKKRRADANATLLVTMEKEGLDVYQFERVTAEVIHSDRVKVKYAPDPSVDTDKNR